MNRDGIDTNNEILGEWTRTRDVATGKRFSMGYSTPRGDADVSRVNLSFSPHIDVSHSFRFVIDFGNA